MQSSEVLVRDLSGYATNQDLARFSLGGLDGGELSVQVWFRARCARMQNTTLLGSRSACRTRDSEDLFAREFSLLHLEKMRRPHRQVCSILHSPDK